MKLSVDGIWVHIACVTWNPSLLFQNIDTMQPCEIRPVLNAKGKQSCAVCGKTVGVPVKCCEPACSKYYHITCAQDAGCLLDAMATNEGVVFTLSCKTHASEKVEEGTGKEAIAEREMEELEEELKDIDWDEVQAFGEEFDASATKRNGERNESPAKRVNQMGNPHSRVCLNPSMALCSIHDACF